MCVHLVNMKLAKWMSDHKFNDAQFAEAIGRSRPSVPRWRNDDNPPDFEALRKIETLTKGQVTAIDFEPTR